jgi:uncharacterized protein YigA (DUF484 family)
MSTQPKPEYLDDGISEQAVRDYLQANPDFFERNSALLGALHLPHGSGGAVSLVERQVSILRQKELRLERKLRELISVARANDALVGKIHALALRLLESSSLDATIRCIEEAMRAGFGADQAVLVLFGDPGNFADVQAGRFFTVVDRDSDALGPFATFLGSKRPRCGQVRDSQREFLFQGDADDIGSVALVPLGRKAQIGFLAIGSTDANRFHPGMSIDFLARVGELVATALERY